MRNDFYSRRPDCVAGHVRLELRNVVAKYPFERSLRFPGIQQNSDHRDYSPLSCGVGWTQLGPRTQGITEETATPWADLNRSQSRARGGCARAGRPACKSTAIS